MEDSVQNYKRDSPGTKYSMSMNYAGNIKRKTVFVEIYLLPDKISKVS